MRCGSAEIHTFKAKRCIEDEIYDRLSTELNVLQSQHCDQSRIKDTIKDTLEQKPECDVSDHKPECLRLRSRAPQKPIPTDSRRNYILNAFLNSGLNTKNLTSNQKKKNFLKLNRKLNRLTFHLQKIFGSTLRWLLLSFAFISSNLLVFNFF